jgi:Protein of unknown function, DUF547
MRSNRGRSLIATALAGAAACFLSIHAVTDLAADETDASIAAATGSAEGDNSVAYSDETYRRLIEKYSVNDGDSVDYAAWQASDADMQALDEFIRAIGRVSPDNHPEQFATEGLARRYWINAYNALVLDSVLDYWPLASVRDVKVSLSSRIVSGKGFFYDREFLVGGRTINLLDLEEQVLESLDDPRLHFALNCASDSCPVLRASDWSEQELERAARDFINNPENVAIEDGRLYLSRIFKWYRKDFPRDIVAYLRNYADARLDADLATAAKDGFPIRYRDYDWSLNASSDEAH